MTLNRPIFWITITLLPVLLFTGCGTTTLQTKSELTRTITLTPDELNVKKVYLRVTGTEASIVQPKTQIVEKLQAIGIEATDDANETNTMIHLNTLFANNMVEAKQYSAAGAAGAIGGVAIGVHNNSTSTGILAGVAIALAMGLAQNILADEVYRSVSDVTIMQKKDNQWVDVGKTRIISEAVKMDLNVTQAKPIMEEQIATKVADIFKK